MSVNTQIDIRIKYLRKKVFLVFLVTEHVQEHT